MFDMFFNCILDLIIEFVEIIENIELIFLDLIKNSRIITVFVRNFKSL